MQEAISENGWKRIYICGWTLLGGRCQGFGVCGVSTGEWEGGMQGNWAW
jgi:hypothetical protein